MRLPILIVALFALPVMAAPVMAAAEGRTSVHLFKYGSTNSSEARIAFLDFRDLMTEKLPRLASELLSSQEIPEVAELALQPVTASDGNGLAHPSERIPSLADRRTYWRRTGALALLTGRVKNAQGDSLSVHSTFFLGELGRVHETEAIDVELPFTAATYDTTNDSHSVAVLYALAMDIANDCAKQSDVFFLLSQAKLRADAVAEDDPSLGQDLVQIVHTALDDAQNTCPTR